MLIETVPVRERPKLRVVVVDDSGFCRDGIKIILEADGDIDVVGEGADGFEALALVETIIPDVVTMDVQMPGKSGLEAVQQIMTRRPVPILVVTAEPLDGDASVAFTAIENGALDVVAKPSFTDLHSGDYLRTVVRRLAKTPVFQHVLPEKTTTMRAAPSNVPEFVSVIAGSGGMPSVLGLLSRLTPGLCCPIVVHQPVAKEMVVAYAKHLSRLAKQSVIVGGRGTTRCRPSEIVLVRNRAVCTERETITVSDEPLTASSLLGSVSDVYGSRSIAVVLAGREIDGIEDVVRLSKRGGHVLVESPSTATVPDLPTAVVRAEIADAVLPLDRLAERLLRLAAIG